LEKDLLLRALQLITFWPKHPALFATYCQRHIASNWRKTADACLCGGYRCDCHIESRACLEYSAAQPRSATVFLIWVYHCDNQPSIDWQQNNDSHNFIRGHVSFASESISHIMRPLKLSTRRQISTRQPQIIPARSRSRCRLKNRVPCNFAPGVLMPLKPPLETRG